MQPLGATVYILHSASNPGARPYTGITRLDASERLRRHNSGDVPATRRHRPWQLHATFWFADEDTAHRFERYLKTGSGHAFVKRHF